MHSLDKYLIGGAQSALDEAGERAELAEELQRAYLDEIRAGQALAWLRDWVSDDMTPIVERIYAIAQRKDPAMLVLAEIQVLLEPLAVAAAEAYAAHEVDEINWDEENVPEWEYADER
jgi:hypothetical protein